MGHSFVVFRTEEHQQKSCGLDDFAVGSLWTVAFQHHPAPNRLRHYDSTPF
jgi:hypothetical protein